MSLSEKGAFPITIENIENNFFAVSRYWGRLNASLKKAGPVWAMSTGVAVSDINWAWNEEPLKKEDQASVLEIREYYKEKNLPFWWWVYPRGQSLETIGVLRAAGLKYFAGVPGMAADLHQSPGKFHPADNITIIPVENRDDLMLWQNISFDGFEMPPHARTSYAAFVSSFEAGAQSSQRLFLACMDGKPAATSLLFIDQNTAGIYYVSTLPAFRNKGCGLRITQAAMQSAREAGCKNVILQATPMGERLYRRLNFRPHCQAEIYTL